MNDEKSTQIDWSQFYGLNDEEEIENAVSSILSKMSLSQKFHQMAGDEGLFMGILKMAKRYNYYPLPAGVDLDLGIPGILFADGPRGCVLGSSTCFPVPMARGASFDPELEERIGNAIGIEIRSQGANFYGGVCINLLRHPAWGRSQETYGEDPFLLGEMGVALASGVQNHIMACAKHYACNSMENMRFKVNVKIDERSLQEIYLRHFKKCVDNGVASIMSAYNKVNGDFCGHNKHLLKEILKEEWGFKGFVVSDFTLGVRSGVKAVNGGMDIEMPDQWKMKPKKLMRAFKKGKISESDVNDSVKRILYQKIRFASPPNPQKYNIKKVACDEHVNLALEAALKSIVLLKNEHSILPLQIKEDSTHKIAVLGELANMGNIGDKGSSRVYPPYVITPLQGIKNQIAEMNAKNINVDFDKGKNLIRAVALAKSSDTVIVVAGFTHVDEGEYIVYAGGDRSSLRLRSRDETLIQAVSNVNENVIVIMEGGSAIITENWRNDVAAIIMAWYPGMMGGTALARILFGEFNPCAKLPCVFPKNIDQLPHFDKKAKEIEYDLYHGYRLMDRMNFTPAFPFGFGLSFSNFVHENLKIQKDTIPINCKIQASLDIRNNSAIDGDEIVQFYVKFISKSSIERPPKQLIGFTKIHVPAGEKISVSKVLEIIEIASYDPLQKQWVVEKLEYELLAGPSSDEKTLLSCKFRIQ